MRLVAIDSVRPSTYNPREADAARLRFVELSLRKLGFVLPIYATKSGEILSGHQRQHVAKSMGFTEIPVEFVDEMDLERRKAVNILFNRATNDLGKAATCASVSRRLGQIDIEALAREIPDADDPFPCMRAAGRPTKPLADANLDLFDRYCVQMAARLADVAPVMPVVVSDAGRVINGVGRLFHLAQSGAPTVPCVVLPKSRADFASAMLNLLTMDFAIEKKYADTLRYNSFRRAKTFRAGLGRGFAVGVFGDVRSKDILRLSQSQARKFTLKYGTYILDFGAGRMTDTAILKAAGISCVPFEPFICDGDKINPDASRENARAFLAEVRTGARFSAIFISSVFNSVPFREDRARCLAICAALCNPKSLLSVWAMSTRHPNVLNDNQQSARRASENIFSLDYEAGIRLGSFSSGNPKVQKYHTGAELRDLCSEWFHSVKMRDFKGDWLVECSAPRPVDPAKLRAALDFEFDLPYPGGERMGLAAEARVAFSKNLGLKL